MKTSYFNNHRKCKWTELTNKMAQSCRIDQKRKPNYILPSGDTSQLQRQRQTQSERVENDISSKWHSERSESSSTNIRRSRHQNKKGKERYWGHFIMVKGIVNQKDTTLISHTYVPSQGALKYVKQLLTELKGETDQNTIVGELNTPVSDIDRSSRQKINNKITSLNDTLEQLDIIDIYRAFHPKTAAYIFFSSARGTFSRINHILGHREPQQI